MSRYGRGAIYTYLCIPKQFLFYSYCNQGSRLNTEIIAVLHPALA